MATAHAPADPAVKYVLSIDQGTTSSRAIIFDHRGSVVSMFQKEHKQIFPQSAWVEHNAEEIFDNVCSCVTGALAQVHLHASNLVSVGITNQRETVVVWDKATGKPLYNAIVWQDQRGAPLCESLAAVGGADRFKHKTGLPLVPYFSASKLRWLLENVPGLRAAAESGHALAGTVDSYLLWKFVGVHATDVSNASRTLLCNIHTLSWDEELCSTFGVPLRMLPTIRPSSHIFGVCGFSTPLPGVPIAGILGDQQAALFGQACFNIGDAKNTYGTGCFLLMNTGQKAVLSTHGLLSTVAYQLEGQPPMYALEGSVAVAGAVISWLKDNLGILHSAKDAEALAASVPDNGGLAFVPAFNGLFAPHWRSDARGVLIGLSGSTHKGHVVRAALEAVALQSKELLDAMAKDARHVIPGARTAARSHELRVDGGMTANSLLMQFQSDITGRPVVRPAVPETTALGAAYAAGLAVGYWGSLDELAAQWREDARWTPQMGHDDVRALTRRWDAAVTRALGWSHIATVTAAAPHHAPTAAGAAAAAAHSSPAAGVVAPTASTVAHLHSHHAHGDAHSTHSGGHGHKPVSWTSWVLGNTSGGGGGGRAVRAAALVGTGLLAGLVLGTYFANSRDDRGNSVSSLQARLRR